LEGIREEDALTCSPCYVHAQCHMQKTHTHDATHIRCH
jgi:hypothetical protein